MTTTTQRARRVDVLHAIAWVCETEGTPIQRSHLLSTALLYCGGIYAFTKEEISEVLDAPLTVTFEVYGA